MKGGDHNLQVGCRLKAEELEGMVGGAVVREGELGLLGKGAEC